MLELEDKSILFIVPEKNFSDRELNESMRVLENQGADISLASKGKETVESSKGILIIPDITLEEVNPQDYDAVVFIGGEGAEELFYDKKVQEIARDFDKEGEFIAALSSGVIILANSGILDEREFTIHPKLKSELEDEYEIKDKEIVIDGNIITAQKKEYAEILGERLAEKLKDSRTE